MKGATHKIALSIIAMVGLFAGVLFLLDYSRGAADSPDFIALVDAPPGDSAITSTDLVPAGQSGASIVYAGFYAVPAGARIFNFLQDGVEANVRWSSVRGYEATFTTAVIQTWTNPSVNPCTAASGQCGHLSIAVPVSGAPGRPDYISVDGGLEEPIDANAWHSQPGSLDLYGDEYHVIGSNSPLIHVGVPVTVRWLPWDGLGAAVLPTP